MAFFMMSQSWKDAWKLMRIPFSVFLMPLFWLGLSVLKPEFLNLSSGLVTFVILHLFLYPASNGYNSLIDKDEGPIGGLKSPPKPNVELQILIILFDLIALVWAFLYDLYFGYTVAVYWIVSKAYSHPKIRLKKFPILSWLVVSVFQGAWTVLMIWNGLLQPAGHLNSFWNWEIPFAASLFMAGTYPITQIYQHDEDGKRGDITISLKLGVRGTFLFSTVFVLLGSAGIVLHFFLKEAWLSLVVLIACAFPGLYFFSRWAMKCWQSPAEANFENTMKFNQISSIGLSLAFFLILCLNIWGKSLLLQPN
jgi:1,4-dihydroxy-2-naphthoate octaprenyltransferase